MNSIRSFVANLLYLSQNIKTPPVSDISLLDSSILENDCIYNRGDFPLFYTKNNTPLSWVVIFENRPYFVSGFGLTNTGNMTKVLLYLREIMVGEKLPKNLIHARNELCLEIMHFGPSIRLSYCPQKTFQWLEKHKATQKVIDMISEPA